MSRTALLTAGSAIAGAVFGALATISSSGFGYLNRDRELDIRMVELGLSILSGKIDDDSEAARSFALRLLRKYANVEVPESEFNTWVKEGSLNFGNVWPAAGFVDTEIRCLTELEIGNAEKEVQPRVQA